MAQTLCNCCGNLWDMDDIVLLVMQDRTVRRVCVRCVNGMWKKFNPDLKAQRDAAKANRASSSGSK